MNPRLACPQVRRLLQSFIDGEVGPDRAELIAAHLESCSRCRIEAETLRGVITALRRLRPDLARATYTRLVSAVEDLTDPAPGE